MIYAVVTLYCIVFIFIMVMVVSVVRIIEDIKHIKNNIKYNKYNIDTLEKESDKLKGILGEVVDYVYKEQK